MKIIISLFAILFLLSCKDQTPAVSCDDLISGEETVEWLDRKIDSLKTDNYKAEVYQLTFAWGKAVLVNPCTQCADFYVYTYDCTGNLICQSGGFAGTNNCPAPYLENSEKTLIWKE